MFFFFRQKFEQNDSFYWTNYTFIEQTILLNKQFYWTNVHWENELNKWKINDSFKNENKIFIFEQLKKMNKQVVYEYWTKDMEVEHACL